LSGRLRWLRCLPSRLLRTAANSACLWIFCQWPSTAFPFPSFPPNSLSFPLETAALGPGGSKLNASTVRNNLGLGVRACGRSSEYPRRASARTPGRPRRLPRSRAPGRTRTRTLSVLARCQCPPGPPVLPPGPPTSSAAHAELPVQVGDTLPVRDLNQGRGPAHS
jgi:hypothetical protein